MNVSPDEPQAGDFLVIYGRPRGSGPTIVLVRVSAEREQTTIRATFSRHDDAGPRFEEEAVAMAVSAGTRAFRIRPGRPYEVLQSDQ